MYVITGTINYHFVPSYSINTTKGDVKDAIHNLVAYSWEIAWEFPGNREVPAIFRGTCSPKGFCDQRVFIYNSNLFLGNGLSGVPHLDVLVTHGLPHVLLNHLQEVGADCR